MPSLCLDHWGQGLRLEITTDSVETEGPLPTPSPTLESTKAKGLDQCLWNEWMGEWTCGQGTANLPECECGCEVRLLFFFFERGVWGIEGLGFGGGFYSPVVWSLFHGGVWWDTLCYGETAGAECCLQHREVSWRGELTPDPSLDPEQGLARVLCKGPGSKYFIIF